MISSHHIIFQKKAHLFMCKYTLLLFIFIGPLHIHASEKTVEDFLERNAQMFNEKSITLDYPYAKLPDIDLLKKSFLGSFDKKTLIIQNSTIDTLDNDCASFCLTLNLHGLEIINGHISTIEFLPTHNLVIHNKNNQKITMIAQKVYEQLQTPSHYKITIDCNSIDHHLKEEVLRKINSYHTVINKIKDISYCLPFKIIKKINRIKFPEGSMLVSGGIISYYYSNYYYEWWLYMNLLVTANHWFGPLCAKFNKELFNIVQEYYKTNIKPHRHNTIIISEITPS